MAERVDFSLDLLGGGAAIGRKRKPKEGAFNEGKAVAIKAIFSNYDEISNLPTE